MKTNNAPLLHIFCCKAIVLLCGCTQKIDSNYEVLARQHISCPDGAQVEYAPWSGKPTGMIARCKLNHGPYIVAVDGRLHLKGESKMGKDKGSVFFFDGPDQGSSQKK